MKKAVGLALLHPLSPWTMGQYLISSHWTECLSMALLWDLGQGSWVQPRNLWCRNTKQGSAVTELIVCREGFFVPKKDVYKNVFVVGWPSLPYLGYPRNIWTLHFWPLPPRSEQRAIIFFSCFHFTFFFLCWQSGSMDLNLSALWWIVPRALHSQVVEKSRPLRLGKHCWFFMPLGWCIARISVHSIHNLYLQMSIMRFMSVVIYTSIYTTFASFQQTDQRNINNIRNNSSHKHTSQQELPLILRVLPVFPRMAMSGPGTKNLWMASIADSAKTCPERTNPDTIHCRSTHGMHWEWRQGPLEPWSMAHVCFCKRGVVGIHSLGRQPKRQDTRKPRNYSHHLYADTYGYIHVREDEVQWPYSGV